MDRRDELDSPPNKMAKLDKKETESLMPIILEEQLEESLNIITDCCKKQDQNQTALNSFFPLKIWLPKLLNDPDINDWESHMHSGVRAKCERALDLCVYTMDADSMWVLDVLGSILDPNNQFLTFNATRMSESVSPGSEILDEKLYARPPLDPSNPPQGWLVDLINRFGNLGGFVILLARFQPGRRSLEIPLIYRLLNPFRLCIELLTVDTIVKYFMPIVERVQVILGALTDKELMETAKYNYSINHDLFGIIAAVKSLVSRIPGQNKIIKNLETLKLRFFFQFVIQTNSDIDELWVKFDSDLSQEQWDSVFEHFQTSWKTENENIHGKLLKLLQQWAKDYRAAISHRILTLLWDLAHSDEVTTEIMEQALSACVEILKHSCPEEYKEKILAWLDKCIEEVKNSDKWVVPALKQIQEIVDMYRKNILDSTNDEDTMIGRHLDEQSILDLVINNLSTYMDKMRQFVKENPNMDKRNLIPDGRYNHEMQVQRRLDFLRYLVDEEGFQPDFNDRVLMWQCLVEQPIFPSDRESGFKWMIASTDPYICFEREDVAKFYNEKILQFDPTLLTPKGTECFEKFFLEVNSCEEGILNTDNFIGKEYLWKVVTICPEDIARLGFQALKKINSDAGFDLKLSDSQIRRNFVAECRDQLQIHNDTLSGVEHTSDDSQENDDIARAIQNMARLTKFLQECMKECGWRKVSKKKDQIEKQPETHAAIDKK